MVPIDMSMEARMVLAKMSFIYEREGGDRIRITRDEDIVRLINYAVESINKELKRYLDTFCKLCTHSELKEMIAQGANIYRGAIVAAEREASEVLNKPTTVMYRGVAVPAPEGQESKPAAQAEPAKPAKAKRVYRGRVIED